MTIRLGVSPITGCIYYGNVNKAGNAFTGRKTDMTSDFLRAVIDKAAHHGGTFPIEGDGRRWLVTVVEDLEKQP